MSKAQVMVYGGTLDFYGVDKIFFPKICLVCGKNSESIIRKSIINPDYDGKEKRKDYHLELPLCPECYEKTKINIIKELIKSFLISIIGIVGAVILYTYTRSVFIAIVIAVAPVIISYFYYKSKISKSIDLEKFIKIRTVTLSQDTANDVLQLVFQNTNYMKYLLDLNLSKNKDLKLVKLLEAKKS